MTFNRNSSPQDLCTMTLALIHLVTHLCHIKREQKQFDSIAIYNKGDFFFFCVLYGSFSQQNTKYTHITNINRYKLVLAFCYSSNKITKTSILKMPRYFQKMALAVLIFSEGFGFWLRISQ